MTSPFSSLRAAAGRPRVALVAGAAAVVLVGGGTTAAFAASSAATVPTAVPTTSATSTPCAPGVRALLRGGSRSLRTDLKHLRSDSAGNRAADRAAIRAKALSGGYGLRTERVARIVAGKDGGVAAAQPAPRKGQAAHIWTEALAGSYGTSIQSLAEEAKARADARCAAEKPGS
jgi:hypothetical protein